MVKEYKETHQTGTISIENVPEALRIPGYMPHLLSSVEGDFGIQIAKDGRVWVCINGVAFIRFKPACIPMCERTLHHAGGVYHCLLKAGHGPDGHRFELPDVDTRVEVRREKR